MAHDYKKAFRVNKELNDYIISAAYENKTDESKYFRMLIQADMKEKKVSQYRNQYQLKRELINEINHIGVNINQIAHHVNGDRYSMQELREVPLLLKEIQLIMSRIID